MAIKTIILIAVVAYLIMGLFWYGRETIAQQSVDAVCSESKLAWWLATIFIILIWPHWLWKRMWLYVYAFKTMCRKR